MAGMGRVQDRARVSDRELVDGVTRVAHPLREGELRGYDPLLEMVGNARIVLLGEASHGTHEFYRERARITTRLIRELGFSFVAIEGDWPEAYRVNQFVRGGPGTARDALKVFDVYPTWMWGNLDTLPDGSRKVGFYGLDLYSLFRSMSSVVEYLEGVDPEAAREARERYACFEPFGGNKDLYAYHTGLGLTESCEAEAVAMLREMRRKREEYLEISPDDSYFYAEMAATVARDGERYYRAMYRGGDMTWNLRDMHMQNTLDALLQHFGPDARAVVWEHNTHIGDFRFTADADGMVNVGQLTRERHPEQSIAIGFGTYQGSVTASRAWGDRPQYMTVPQATAGSYDNVFHQTGIDRFMLLLKPLRDRGQESGLAEWRGQRAIGVVYHPEYEQGNYVPTRLSGRYDAYIHIDRTKAVKPLGIEPTWRAPVLEDTYPTGY
jgi:erythromycin esterase-like protein